MAGDWIKFEHATPDKPEVYSLTTELGIDPDTVVGKLIRVWIWASVNCPVSGRTGVGAMSAIDRITNVQGFARAMEKVGWLKIEKDSIVFPNFNYHCSQSAKERALDARRKQEKRSGLRPDSNRTKTGPEKRREEKRREEEKEQEVLPVRIAPISAGELPSDLSPAMLARQWCFVCTRRFNGRSKDDERDMAGEFANLEGLGVPAAAMLEEINRGPPQRDRGEHFWQFKDRLMERFNLKQQATGKPAKKSALDRLIEGAGTRKP